MKAIFYDGRAEGASAAAKAERKAIPPEDGPVRTRDASAWVPGHELERFDAVSIPDLPEFDALAAAYAAADAEVVRQPVTATSEGTEGDGETEQQPSDADPQAPSAEEPETAAQEPEAATSESPAEPQAEPVPQPKAAAKTRAAKQPPTEATDAHR